MRASRERLRRADPDSSRRVEGASLFGLVRYGKTLVEHLVDPGLLPERLSAAHAIWLAGDALHLATAGSAKVFGFEKLGRLAVGGVKSACSAPAHRTLR